MKSLEANKDKLDSLNIIAVGLSVDSAPTKKAWAESMGISNTGLLADFWPHGGVAALYGIFREADGFSERANILIDETGKVAFVRIYPIKELPSIDDVIQEIKKLG